ncbi:hypothetical protein AMC75_11705 [Staphylococcus carnosus]|uniref:hypothetical protein n=1 Tax=Staphylococcus carnosus TaxID=1281 RepID=UPI0006AB9094|nr:hypothetical protein [Staphylococcus carnosus]KOR12023.1 hypothetical protein AMC75_11705 [Staphylococcus carnosus]
MNILSTSHDLIELANASGLDCSITIEFNDKLGIYILFFHHDKSYERGCKSTLISLDFKGFEQDLEKVKKLLRGESELLEN